MKTKIELYQFSKLSDEAKASLVDELAQWGPTVFHVSAEALRGYWLESKSYDTSLYILRAEDGSLVGTTTLKWYRVNYEGKDIDIIKVGLGVDPKHRGNKLAARCILTGLIRWRATHPFRPLYLFSTLIHPVTYKLSCDLLNDRLYPYFKSPENPKMQKMVEYLADLFGVEKADSPHPFVYKEHFSAIETQAATNYWRNNQRPEIRFFVEHCPNYYCSGDCLIGLAPVGVMRVILLGLRTIAKNRMTQWRDPKPRFA